MNGNFLNKEHRIKAKKAHDAAMRARDKFYRDPVTNDLVFTSLQHMTRGYCCKSGCRHCPYGFVKKED